MKFNLLIVLACCAALTSAKTFEVQRCDYLLQNEIEMMPMGMWENIQECATSVVNALLDLGSDLTETTNETVQTILRFKDLVMQCYNEPSKTAQAKCVVTNVREFKDLISKILGHATEIVTVFKEKGEHLINSIMSCHLNDSVNALYEFTAKADKCY